MGRVPRLLWTCALIGVAGTAGASTCDRLGAADWLIGEWLARNGQTVVRESWHRASPETFEGTGETRSTADDTVVDSEVLRLVQMADAVFYVAKVAHNPLPVAFRLTECTATRLVFENPGHDFPRRLEYALSGDGRLSVVVSDGGSRGFTLHFLRQGT